MSQLRVIAGIGAAVVAAGVTLTPAAAAGSTTILPADTDTLYTTARTAHSVTLHWSTEIVDDSSDGTRPTRWLVTYQAGTSAPGLHAKHHFVVSNNHLRPQVIKGLKRGKPYTATIWGEKGSSRSKPISLTFAARVAGAHVDTIGKHELATVIPKSTKATDVAVATSASGKRYAAFATAHTVYVSHASASGPWSGPQAVGHTKIGSVGPVELSRSKAGLAVAWDNFGNPRYRVQKAHSARWSKTKPLHVALIKSFAMDDKGKLHLIAGGAQHTTYVTNTSGTWTRSRLAGIGGAAAIQGTSMTIDPATQRVVVGAAVPQVDSNPGTKEDVVSEVAAASSTSKSLGDWHVINTMPLTNAESQGALATTIASDHGATLYSLSLFPLTYDRAGTTSDASGVYLASGTTPTTVGHFGKVAGANEVETGALVSLATASKGYLLFDQHTSPWRASTLGVVRAPVSIASNGKWSTGKLFQQSTLAYDIAKFIGAARNGHIILSYLREARTSQHAEDIR